VVLSDIVLRINKDYTYILTSWEILNQIRIKIMKILNTTKRPTEVSPNN